jgi:serine/threonine-protein kinase
VAAPRVGERVGPYRLEGVLGEGGMGVVFRAVHESDGRTVALKILRPELALSRVFLRRFAREGEIASALAHDHLVEVVDSGEAEGRHYLATRYVEGRSLAAWLAADGPLPLADVVRLAHELGGALDALHRRGLVHRDVKPSNVMVDSEGRSALTDFGVARGTADSVLTSTGLVVGTPDYLAPEVLTGQPAAAASDLYGLGCVIYECVAGRAPFAHRSMFETTRAHIEEEPADPSADRPDASPSFGWAVLLALAKRPEDRPATGRAYARVLAAATS